jgi:hypothetical protein
MFIAYYTMYQALWCYGILYRIQTCDSKFLSLVQDGQINELVHAKWNLKVYSKKVKCERLDNTNFLGDEMFYALNLFFMF